jgi:Leucine-rich repeat (LRR) protein
MTVCTWKGVTCTDGKVTTLNLIDAKLEGTIPSSLGEVTTLTHLYLASNSFQGTVPTKVANLPNLQVIDLSFNQLNGTLPLLASSAMQTIELGHNRFTGTLAPNTGKGMNDLQIFDIKYNLVTGTIPTLKGSFPSLIELDWSNNQFIGKSYASSIAIQIPRILLLTKHRPQRNHSQIPWSADNTEAGVHEQ